MVSVEGAEKNREGGEKERERGKKEWREREKENKDFADTVTAAENRRSRKANNVNSSLSCVQRQDWHPSPKTNRLGENSFCFCIWFGAPTDWMRPTHSGGGVTISYTKHKVNLIQTHPEEWWPSYLDACCPVKLTHEINHPSKWQKAPRLSTWRNQLK